MLPLLLAVASGIHTSSPIVGENVNPIQVGGITCHPRNLLVQVDSEQRTSDFAQFGAILVRYIPEISYAIVQAPAGHLLDTKKTLEQQPGVLRVELDRAAKCAYTPNDPYWPQQWHSVAIHADTAWDTTKGSSSVIVAVIDTGVDMVHPDLAANIWTNAGETGGNGQDDDHNGYVDDVHGWDFVNNDNDPSDDAGHGTCCSGLVAAVQDNNIGVTGVAPHCQIMPIKAANSSGYFYNSATVPAYIYAANNGAKVFSMSFFADSVSAAEETAMLYAVSKGVLPVAAAGNADTVYTYYPGAYECVLSVAALDTGLGKASFSDYGSWVDVSCPGVGLCAPTMDGNYTTGFAGTSGSCPQVAGVAALCFSVNPSATPEQVRDAIEDSATLQSQAPYGNFSNYGLVNASAAVQRMLGGSVAAKPSIIRWASWLPGNVSTGSPTPMAMTPVRIYGRGLGTEHSVSVRAQLRNLPIVSQTRDYVDVIVPQNPVPLSVRVDGSTIATIPTTGLAGHVWPLSEASSDGATLTGGFFDTVAADSRRMTVTRRSDGIFLVEGTFKMVGQPSRLRLTVRRQYTGTTVGTESLQLYDWSSASYPYGSFVTVSSQAVPTAMTTGSWLVPNPTRYADYDGTVYFRLITSSDITSGAQLLLDQVALSMDPQ